MALYNAQWRASSDTQITLRNPGVLTIQGNAGGLTLVGGTASGDDLTLQSTSHATKGTIFLDATNNIVVDQVNGRVGIATASPGYPLQVAPTNTATSGAQAAISINQIVDPSGASTANMYGLDVVQITATGATTKATNYLGSRYLVHRNSTDSGAITLLRGLQLQALNTAALGVGEGSATTIEGVYMQAFDNSSTTTATTTIRGANISFGISSNTVASRTFTTAEGALVAWSMGAGSTSTTITTLNVLNVDAAITGSLNRTGTVTNARGIYVTGFTTTGVFGSGLTFTNAPAQIHLDSMSISGSIGIRQQGATPHNRFQGFMTIGADAAPATSAALDISTTTGALLVPRMTTTQKNNLTAANGMIVYDTTLGKFQGYEAGAWTSFI